MRISAKVVSLHNEIVLIWQKEYLEENFRKIDPTGKATRMFYSVPGQLNKNASRYQISSVIEQGKQDRVEELLQDMEDSKVVLFSHHADDPNVGLSLHEDMGRYLWRF